MSVTEVLGFATGALCVWLTVRQSVWNFPVGIANDVAFGVLSLTAGLYAGAALQVVYLVLAVLGWRWWLHGGSQGGPLLVQRTPARGWVYAVAGTLLGTVALEQVLARWTDSPAPALDALTTSLSLVAQLMLDRKWLGNWAVWIVADVLFVALYASQGLWLAALLYAGFVALCVQGAQEWGASLRVPAAVAVVA